MTENSSNSKLNFNDTRTAYEYMTDKDLKKAVMLFKTFSYPWLVKNGGKLSAKAMKMGIPIKGLIKKTIFNHFCSGESIEDSRHKIELLNKYNVKTILDYSVEGEDSESVFDATAEEVKRTVVESSKSDAIPFAVFKPSGLARFDLLAKISAKEELNDSEKAEFERTKARINSVCKKCDELNVQLLIDAEHSWIQPAVDDLVLEMSAKYNKGRVLIFNTLQMYRHDRVTFLKECFDKYDFPLGVKFVRGAYMEIERERAAKMNYPSPINPDKESTDKEFDEGVEICLKNIDRCEVLIGTHNETSCVNAVNLMAELNIEPSDSRVFFAQLLGMSDNISFNLANAGYNVAKYVPYGPVISVMPYLSRRAEENSSIAGQSSRELNLLMKEQKRRKN